jgi:transcriptional regulator with XRE-family HTH domain
LKAAELLTWRKKRSLTRKQLADVLGTTVTTVYRWETAAREIPPFLHLALKWLEKEGGELKRKGMKTKTERR